MADDPQPIEMPPADDAPRKGLLAMHPKLGILLIAGVFYVLLFAMCGLVAVIIWQGSS